jgi:predicted transcriptional regulator
MKAQARRLDRGETLPAALRVSFEDPADLLDILSPARLRLMRKVEAKAMALSVLTKALARDPSAVRKDVAVLERNQLLRTRRISNPGHGVQTIVERAAVSIELLAVI